VAVIVNGIDTSRFQPHAVNGMRRELGLRPGAPVIGSIGRLDPIKAYDLMLQAFAELRAGWSEAHGPPPYLVLVGDGPERDRLSALVERHALRDAARLVGWRKHVEDIYPVFDVFTLSSWSEGTSLGLLEAMSCGVCPVVTNVGGSPATLGESLHHRLVPPGDPTALAAAWRAALADGPGRTRDAATARQRVERAFGVEAMVREYERIYTAQ
ncbi:MAG TPA: glycosyltransferase, partial [Gemmatimonadales bacterium]|nr:glycosyltransferase [Gemmatimonadales bacterium]